MNRTVLFSPLLLAVALSPAFLQQVSCDRSGDPTLVSLEIVAGGLDRVVSFSGEVTAYDVWTTAGVDALIVRATPAAGSARVNYRLTAGGELTAGLVGIGGGEVTLMIPPDTPVGLQLDVTDAGARRLYVLDINPPCSPGQCDDNSPCSSDACMESVCEFTVEPDGNPLMPNCVVPGCPTGFNTGYCLAGACLAVDTCIEGDPVCPTPVEVHPQCAYCGCSRPSPHCGTNCASTIENADCLIVEGSACDLSGPGSADGTCQADGTCL